jgi:hypothetical protein
MAIEISQRVRSQLQEYPRRDNGSDHRAGTIDLQAEKGTRKSGFACIALLSSD